MPQRKTRRRGAMPRPEKRFHLLRAALLESFSLTDPDLRIWVRRPTSADRRASEPRSKGYVRICSVISAGPSTFTAGSLE